MCHVLHRLLPPNHISIVFPSPPPPPRSNFHWFSSSTFTLSTPHWLYIGRTSPPTSTLHRPYIDLTIKREGGGGGEKLQRVIELIIFSSQLGVLMIKSRRVFGTFYSQLVVSYFKPTDITCVMKPWLQHIGFSLVYGPLALKTWRYCKKICLLTYDSWTLTFLNDTKTTIGST